MKKLFVINYLLMLLLFSCNNNLKNDSLNDALKEMPENALFTIKDINAVSWDTMFISKPYNYELIRNKKLNIPSDVDKTFGNISQGDEGRCILIFVKNHTLVNYSIIPRTSIADFAFIDSLNQGLPSNTQFKIISDSIFPRKVVVSFN